jgi:hypothetical protein
MAIPLAHPHVYCHHSAEINLQETPRGDVPFNRPHKKTNRFVGGFQDVSFLSQAYTVDV